MMFACTHAPSKNVAHAIDNNYAHALLQFYACTFVNCWRPALYDLHGDNYSVKMLTHAGEMAQLPQYSRLPRLLMVEPDQDGLIAPSTISQKHISQRVSGSYPVQKAVELMETAEKLGFGKMVQYETPISKRRGKRFRKQHYSSLPHTAK